MSLNPQAKEWLPPGVLSKQFMTLAKEAKEEPVEEKEENGVAHAKAKNGDFIAQVEEGKPRQRGEGTVTGVPVTGPPTSSPVAISGGHSRKQSGKEQNIETRNGSQEDELEFDEVFERLTNEGSSPRSTPRASLVGPSPLPSPAASPQLHTFASLIKQTENLSVNGGSMTNKGNDRSNAPAANAMCQASDQATTAEQQSTSAEQHSMSAMRDSAQNEDATEQYNHDDIIPTVRTHVETDVSAAATAASGTRRKLGPEDFELLRVVGQGAFGKVFQVRKRDTGEVFAMKVMRKDRILEKSHEEYVKAERNALTAVVHPYIVTLRYSFQTPNKLYLVLDFINGGHLFFQLYRAGTFDENLAKLYTAELVSAVSYLHSLGFVHRDLKPENVLLDADGHVKVTDFGLAKGNMSDAEQHRTNSFIGTMEYMAPEVIQGKGHGKAVDWWSTGILLYEMLCGVPPFRAKSRAALQKLITSGKFKLPPYLSSEAGTLLKGLLQKDASKRLGFGPDGSENIKNHAFFKGIDWKKLESRSIQSPFRPNIQSHDSVENFDKIWTDLPPQDSPCTTPTKNSIQDNTNFEGFTYCAPSLLAQFSPEHLHKRKDTN